MVGMAVGVGYPDGLVRQGFAEGLQVAHAEDGIDEQGIVLALDQVAVGVGVLHERVGDHPALFGNLLSLEIRDFLIHDLVSSETLLNHYTFPESKTELTISGKSIPWILPAVLMFLGDFSAQPEVLLNGITCWCTAWHIGYRQTHSSFFIFHSSLKRRSVSFLTLLRNILLSSLHMYPYTAIQTAG